MFFAARDRFNERQKYGLPFTGESYVHDLMRQYGNGGRKIELPQRENFDAAAEFRRTELQRFEQMKMQFAALQTEHKTLRNKTAQISKAYLDATRDRGHSDRDHRDDDGASVLPPETRADEDDGRNRASLISSTKPKDATSTDVDRGERIRDVSVHEAEPPSSEDNVQAGAGGPPTGSPDPGESDLGGPSSEHSTKG